MIRFFRGFIELFISGLITAIFLSYLIDGFAEVLEKVNEFLIWIINNAG